MRQIITILLLGLLIGNIDLVKSQDKPNVIIIITDDQGYNDVGFNGCKDIPTPNIDRIANNGVKFTNAYVTYAVCGPSRAGLMTGRYQDRFGFGRNPLFAPNDSTQGVPLSEELLSTVLKREDYNTMAIGKWHLGAYKTLQPRERGFDEFFGFLTGGHRYFPEEWIHDDYLDVPSQWEAYKTKLLHNGERVREQDYLTDALSREAVSFVERNADEAFFMYLAYNAPHAPMQATEKYLNRFKHIEDKKRRTYAAMVSAVDEGVGLILNKLEELGIEENTIIFFLSDNGGPEKKNGSNNDPLRDGKGSLYEGGIRVPFAMQWPAKVLAGQVYDNPIISLDIFATACEYANAKPKNELDGVNLVPYLNGEKKGKPHESLYWRIYDEKSYAVRTGDYKVVKYLEGVEEIYNLQNDVSEENPLNAKQSGKQKDLKRQYDMWNAEQVDPVFLGLNNGKRYNKQTPDRWTFSSRKGRTYYIHSEKGSDNNSGWTKEEPLKSFSKFKKVILLPGDSVLLANGQMFNGTFQLKNLSGKEGNPIVISNYKNDDSDKLPLIDAKGYAEGILLENCKYLTVENIQVTANAGGFNNQVADSVKMRCGVLIKSTQPGNYSNLNLKNISVSDVFYEEPGFERGAEEVKTANGKQKYGYGIWVINYNSESIIKYVKIDSCMVTNVGHTGIKITGNYEIHGIQNITISNCNVFQTGGPGMQMSGVKNGHVHNNLVNESGNKNDSRKWGRGSGLWTWGCEDVVIEKNTFKNAKGPGDSAGCHIDFNCKNVIVQYNFSMNNAGGFCEILGNNHNCAYRYNVSVNDGHRVKGENGAFQEGKVFWLSGYVGKNNDRHGPYNSYFYNNTIYVSKNIEAKIAVDRAAKGVLIANNIFCFEGISRAVKGDQYNPEKNGGAQIENVVFKNNLYLNKKNWPKQIMIQDESPIHGNPEFVNKGGLTIRDFIPSNINLIKDQGIIIEKIPLDTIGLKPRLKAEFDILGNKVSEVPGLGAIEL